ERFNIFNNIVYGYYTKIIPVKNDPAQTWTSWIYSTEESPIEIDQTAYDFITKYYNALKSGVRTGHWNDADKALNEISDYQQKWGKNVMPSESEINLEILYNKANTFFWVMIAYSMLGFILVLLSFTEVLTLE